MSNTASDYDDDDDKKKKLASLPPSEKTPSTAVPPSAIPKPGRSRLLRAGMLHPPVTGVHIMRVLSSTKFT